MDFLIQTNQFPLTVDLDYPSQMDIVRFSYVAICFIPPNKFFVI